MSESPAEAAAAGPAAAPAVPAWQTDARAAGPLPAGRPDWWPRRHGPLPPGPHLDPDGRAVTFVLPDEPGVTPTKVWFHLRDFGADPRFRRAGDRWVARIPRPPADRLEYLLDVHGPDGTGGLLVDPTNPRRVRGVFGDHSVVEFPGYHAPAWLPATPTPPAEQGSLTPVEVRDPDADVTVTGAVWSPAGARDDDPLGLLVVHDGPEYADLAALLDHLRWLSRTDPALATRALLLQPVDRDRSYSASPAYARALVEELLPEVRAAFGTRGPTVGLGASLGALALLHAAATRPGSFGGLALQSGSFFQPRYDAHEARFRYYDRVVETIARLHASPQVLGGTVVGASCGTAEENLDNNRALVRRLRDKGVRATLTENRDGHNYTGWRDCLDPVLDGVLREVWGSADAGPR
ncbi:MAG: alpha/beta hydrolase-fold protein [Candidatus Nanopelagicales bacterium]